MKKQKTNGGRPLTTILVVCILFVLSACNANQETRTGKNEQTANEQAPVNPPAIDIHTATVLGDMDAILQHIQAGTDLNKREPAVGSTPLISAAVFGKTEVAKALIEAGSDVNLKNNLGSTALHSAAFLCRKEIVEMLLENGANKELQNIYGTTALQSVSGSFGDVKSIYDTFSKDLGPLGFKLDYSYVEKTRPLIVAMLK